MNEKDILSEIVANKRQEVETFKQVLPLRKLYAMVEQKLSLANAPVPSMRQSLVDSGTGIIAEFKRKSPSKGWIRQDGSAEIIPLAYQANGAAAISILTDTKYFGGYDEYIMYARESGVVLPILYKNFIIDEYQLLQARHCGASAVLLIAAVLEKSHCQKLIDMAHALGLEVLLELHGERDFEQADLEPDMYGINNRNLGTFNTDVQNSLRLAGQLPAGSCKVSESGISSADTIARLRQGGFKGFLIGEHFMRAASPGEELGSFISQLKSKL